MKYLSQNIHIRLHVLLEIIVIIGITFDITEILLKVALNTITVTLTLNSKLLAIIHLYWHTQRLTEMNLYIVIKHNT